MLGYILRLILVIRKAMLFFIFREGGASKFVFWNSHTEVLYKDAIFAIMLIALALTLASGITYLIKNREVYSNEKAH